MVFSAAAPAFAADGDAATRAQAALDKAVEFLKSQQKDTGGWHGEKEPPALTALVLKAIVVGRPQDKQAAYVRKGYENLLSNQLADGGIYRDLLANYNTAIAVSALAASGNPEYR